MSLALPVNRNHSAFYTDVVDGVSSLVEMVGNTFVPVVVSVSQVLFGAGVEVVSRFADMEFSATGAINNVHDVVHYLCCG